MVALTMNWRSRLTGIATGDQAMFATRAAFESVSGFPPIALMEDVAASARLKRVSRPLCLTARVTTSGRRWLIRLFPGYPGRNAAAGRCRHWPVAGSRDAPDLYESGA